MKSAKTPTVRSWVALFVTGRAKQQENSFGREYGVKTKIATRYALPSLYAHGYIEEDKYGTHIQNNLVHTTPKGDELIAGLLLPIALRTAYPVSELENIPDTLQVEVAARPLRRRVTLRPDEVFTNPSVIDETCIKKQREALQAEESLRATATIINTFIQEEDPLERVPLLESLVNLDTDDVYAFLSVYHTNAVAVGGLLMYQVMQKVGFEYNFVMPDILQRSIAPKNSALFSYSGDVVSFMQEALGMPSTLISLMKELAKQYAIETGKQESAKSKGKIHTGENIQEYYPPDDIFVPEEDKFFSDTANRVFTKFLAGAALVYEKMYQEAVPSFRISQE